MIEANLSSPNLLPLLNKGEINILGQITSASNYVFLVELELGDKKALAVYKPVKGERPLWDFPSEISKRERAAYLVSEQLGWGLIPTTIIREGPLGIGSLQAFVDTDEEKHYLSFTPIDKALHKDALERLCALDIVINSTDRQSSHILTDKSGRLYAVDNALTFHTDFKLRTIIWDFAGAKIADAILKDLNEFVGSPIGGELKEILSEAEIEATLERTNWLIEAGNFPDDPGGHYGRPWPL